MCQGKSCIKPSMSGLKRKTIDWGMRRVPLLITTEVSIGTRQDGLAFFVELFWLSSSCHLQQQAVRQCSCCSSLA